jgi:hypothetical protein
MNDEPVCDHEWVPMPNEPIQDEEMCAKCWMEGRGLVLRPIEPESKTDEESEQEDPCPPS